jgi:hypothetical protein
MNGRAVGTGIAVGFVRSPDHGLGRIHEYAGFALIATPA